MTTNTEPTTQQSHETGWGEVAAVIASVSGAILWIGLVLHYAFNAEMYPQPVAFDTLGMLGVLVGVALLLGGVGLLKLDPTYGFFSDPAIVTSGAILVTLTCAGLIAGGIGMWVSGSPEFIGWWGIGSGGGILHSASAYRKIRRGHDSS